MKSPIHADLNLDHSKIFEKFTALLQMMQEVDHEWCWNFGEVIHTSPVSSVLAEFKENRAEYDCPEGVAKIASEIQGNYWLLRKDGAVAQKFRIIAEAP